MSEAQRHGVKARISTSQAVPVPSPWLAQCSMNLRGLRCLGVFIPPLERRKQFIYV
jgi:hypothetical protein